jgi:hypothetical protein
MYNNINNTFIIFIKTMGGFKHPHPVNEGLKLLWPLDGNYEKVLML